MKDKKSYIYFLKKQPKVRKIKEIKIRIQNTNNKS